MVDGVIVDVGVQRGASVTEAVEVGTGPVGVGVGEPGVAVRVPEGVAVMYTVVVGLIAVGEGGSVPSCVCVGSGVAVNTGAGVGLIPINSSCGTVGG